MCWLCPAPGPWDLVGRGAARGRTTYPSLPPFFGLVFLLTPGAGLGAWVGHGVTGWLLRSRAPAINTINTTGR